MNADQVKQYMIMFGKGLWIDAKVVWEERPAVLVWSCILSFLLGAILL